MRAKITTSRSCKGCRKRHFFRRRQGHLARTATPSGGRTWDGFSKTFQAALQTLELARKGLPLPATEIGHVPLPDGRSKPGVIMYAPEVLSLDPENRNAFLGFLYAYRYANHVAPTLEQHGRRTSMISLRSVKRMELDAALVMVAEYYRLCRLGNVNPKIVDEDWPAEIREQLRQLGFYDFVQAIDQEDGISVPDLGRKFVKFESGSAVHGAQARAIIEKLTAVAGSTPRREEIYSGLVEAMMNVNNHAYKDRPPEVFKPLDNWWIAGSYEPGSETLEFVVFDQGVGIPTRIPSDQSYFASLKRLLKGSEDADLIEAAIELGQTSTDLPERGNGMWTICQVVEKLPGSNVRIVSGRGDVTYSSDTGTLSKRTYKNPFPGTLVQWTLQMPSEIDAARGPLL